MLIESRPSSVLSLHLYLCCAYWDHVNYIVKIIWMISLMSSKSVEHRKTLWFTELGLTNKSCWRLDMGACKPQVNKSQQQGRVNSRKLFVGIYLHFKVQWGQSLHPILRRLGVYLTLAEMHWHSEILLWKPCILLTLSIIEVLSLLLRWRCDSCHSPWPPSHRSRYNSTFSIAHLWKSWTARKGFHLNFITSHHAGAKISDIVVIMQIITSFLLSK